jgi:hypothetical protein
VDQLGKAEGQRAAQSEEGALLPDLPEDCRATERANIVRGDRLDVAVIKATNALDKQNDRTLRCAGFYDGVKEGVEQDGR